MKKYVSVWWRLAQMAFLMQLANRWSSLGWLGGKMVRLVFFLIFLAAIFNHVPSVAGYSLKQVAIFFLTFNLVDIIAQIFLRGLYMIGRDIREGDMDFYLIQPVHPLFRISSNLVDFLDFITLIPVLALTLYFLKGVLTSLPPQEIWVNAALYCILCLNGVVIAFCLHVLIASVTVRTQQMENTIWLYRDLVSLGRFPVDVYTPFLQVLLTFALPVAVMVSFPAKVLLGTLSFKKIIFAFFLSGTLLAISLSVWKRAVRRYCSVSS